jgi:hypothetical protein
VFALLGAVMLLCSAATRARAGDLYEAARYLPADLDLAVAVEDASRWRGGVLGPTLSSLADTAARSADLDEAWGRLAATLKMTSAEAFDALLGHRVLFVQRGGRDGVPPSWALVCEVDRGVERQLTQRLDAAPRRLEGGRAAYSLEGGRYWLAVAPHGEGATILLGPSSAPGLFDELSPRLGEQGAAVPEPRTLTDLREMRPDAQAWMLARTKRPEPDGHEWLGVCARAQGEMVLIDASVRGKRLESCARDAQAWSRSAFDTVSSGAMLAIAEQQGGAEKETPWSLLHAAARALPPIAPLRKGGGPGLFGPRAVLVLREGDDGVSFAAAVETRDVDEAAKIGDSSVTVAMAMLATASGRSVQPGDAATTDLGGAFPEAVRSIDVPTAGGLLGGGGGEPAQLAWTSRYTADVRPAEAGERAGAEVLRTDADAGDGARPGWWIVGLGARGVTSTADALGAPEVPGASRAWLSMGTARPAALAERARGLGIPVPPALARTLEVMGMIDAASWALVRAEDGSLRGQGELRLAAPGR